MPILRSRTQPVHPRTAMLAQISYGLTGSGYSALRVPILKSWFSLSTCIHIDVLEAIRTFMLTKLPLSRSSALFLLFAVGVLVAALVSASAASAVPDTRQIGYRYVEQMRAGNGLVFNAGDRVLLTRSEE